ncbi:hypothetical protein P168DRAFT_177929 [Aspergillus campestris IBT 28561]|uniref:Uncharacterized protein n=1 Tax=Aspergillus campestris (strain IBT 28561) TaxID=1392248 RepID=A0A2I1CZV0_ASPC2|nr:uncharacterized protein P168DRAFT_177929 [Aspergillus campestris IBT 28561]PKY03145.1 hypothetical protein P168DRAFT_177929 [Aspergillus campestris IBT 28561]
MSTPGEKMRRSRRSQATDERDELQERAREEGSGGCLWWRRRRMRGEKWKKRKKGWKEKKKQGGKSQKRDDRSESLPSFLSLCGVQPLCSLDLTILLLSFLLGRYMLLFTPSLGQSIAPGLGIQWQLPFLHCVDPRD